MQYDYEMHSVDLSETFYKDRSKKAGFMAEEAANALSVKNYHLHLGGYVLEFMDKIGGDIDFLLLDTAHCLAGEVLDFIALLPYLKDGAIVLLHDMVTGQYLSEPQPLISEHYSNIVLYSSVSAEKYYNFIPTDYDQSERRLPNIAAFRVNSDTRKNIMSVFGCLMIPWRFIPNANILDLYAKHIHGNYDKHLCVLYDEAVNSNVLHYGLCEGRFSFFSHKTPAFLIYGAGKLGKQCYNQIKKSGLDGNLVAWFDKEADKIGDIDNVKIKSPEKIKSHIKDVDYCIVAALSSSEVRDMVRVLVDFGVDVNRILTYKRWMM